MEIIAVLSHKIQKATARWRVISPEIFYQCKASHYGVQYIGLNKKHRIVLFQDPVTGSSFAIKAGERVETGIRRVRERFGLNFTC